MRIAAARDGRGSRSDGPCGARLRFGRRDRITDSSAFARVMRKGRRLTGSYAVMWSVPGGAPGGARLGVVAAKRVFRRAVDRNRAKRLLREAFRLNRAALRGDVDVVLMARAAILGVGRAAVECDLLGLAARNRLLAQGAESVPK